MDKLLWIAMGVLWVGAAAVFIGAVRGVRASRLWWLALGTAGIAWLPGNIPATGNHHPLLAIGLTVTWVSLLVDAVRSQRTSSEGAAWALTLAIGGLSLPAVLAHTAPDWVKGWLLLDVAALVADIGRLSRPKHRNQAVWVFFGRGTSWALALGGAALASQSPASSPLAAAGPVLWWVALALRLTVGAFQPGFVPRDRPAWRLTLAVLNLLATLAAIKWLYETRAAIPESVLAATSLLALWGAWRWNRAHTPMSNITAGGMALGSLALLTAGWGDASSTLAWQVLAVAIPAGIAWVPYRHKGLWVYFLLLLLPLSMAPLTLGAQAAALWTPPYRWWMAAAWLTLVLADVAIGRQGIRLPPAPTPPSQEERSFYLFGLGLWSVIPWGWAMLYRFPPNAQWAFHLGLGTGGLAIGALLFAASRRGHLRPSRMEAASTRWLAKAASSVFWKTYRFIAHVLHFFSALLEGEGGVLWALVLLAMLAVLVQH